jgi:hypothetical protein
VAGRTVVMSEEIRKLYEPQCPSCGWWRGQHRPATVYAPGCPEVATAQPAEPADSGAFQNAEARLEACADPGSQT